jgi:hypothetical protein
MRSPHSVKCAHACSAHRSSGWSTGKDESDGDHDHDDSPEYWTIDCGIDRLHIGQLLGPDVELSRVRDGLADALLTLMDREHDAVVAALLDGYGSTEDLFIALWRSNRSPDDRRWLDDDDDESDDDQLAETDWDILNDLTAEKMAGYEWIAAGCESRGPIRCRAEMDDWNG